MQRIPVFVISLANQPERRRAVAAHLDRLGIEFEIVDGVYGNDLPPEEVERVRGNRNLPLGHVGCCLSHLAAYRRIVDRELPAALVLEDDAALRPRVRDLLRHGLDSAEFDICLLDCEDRNNNVTVFYDADDTETLAPGFVAHTLSDGPHTLHAALVSNAGARTRLEHALPILEPIDCYERSPVRLRIKAVVSPKLAGVAEVSRLSGTSGNDLHAGGTLPLASLRGYPWFYPLRDLIKLRPLRMRRTRARMLAEGRLDPSRRWKTLPSGREIIPRPE